jgi:hypothetical protein
VTASCELKEQGKPYPRTCPECGLGPCKRKPLRMPASGCFELFDESGNPILPVKLPDGKEYFILPRDTVLNITMSGRLA